MPLLTTMTMIGRSYCTAVANSWPFIRKQPSPAKATTVRSGMQRLGGDRGRHAVAHRAGGRRRLRGEAAEAVEAMHPGGVVAGAVGEDGVVGQHLFQIVHDRPHLDRAGPGLRRRRPVEIGGVRLRRLGRPGRRAGRLALGESLDEGRGRGVDRQRRPVDAAEFAGVGMDMDQRLVGVGALQQRVVGGRHLAHAAADQQHEVGLLDRAPPASG